MFRDDTVDVQNFVIKFKQLKLKLDARMEVNLDSEYHQQLKMYIVRLYRQICGEEVFTSKDFSDIREAEMSILNRLQKLKNGTSYKKDKHKAQRQNEDWG